MNRVSVLLDEFNDVDNDVEELKNLDILSSSKIKVFKDDPVAMAAAVYRTHCEHPARGDRWADLESAEISEQDRRTSAEIRKYYADRILISMLKNKTVSKFRRKLYGVVTNSLQLEQQEVGLLYRLPYFYQEDCVLDRVVQKTDSTVESGQTDRVQDKFTVIERVLRSRSAGDYSQFWMQGQNNSAAFLLSVKCDNPYHRLITNLVKQPVTLSGWAHVKVHNGHHRGWRYYMLSDIELIQ